MNDYGKPQSPKAHQGAQVRELIDQLNLLEAVDRRITPEHVARRFRELLNDVGDPGQPASAASAEDDAAAESAVRRNPVRRVNLVDLSVTMQAAIAAARGAAADIIADAEQRARASKDELQRAHDEIAAARRQIEQIAEAGREQAGEALKQAAKIVRDASEQAEQIISEARREAEEIVKAAQEERLAKASSSPRQDQPGMVRARPIAQHRGAEAQISSADATAPDRHDPSARPHNDPKSALRSDAEGFRLMFEEIDKYLVEARTGRLSADQAVKELYAQHYRALVRLAALLVRDTPTAEEVVLDTFTAMRRDWAQLRAADKALAYLRQEVVNRSRSVLRHRTVADKNIRKASPDEHGALLPRERSAVVAALGDLPERQREAIVLRYYADLSEAEIAAAMGISRGTVKSHTTRGMAVLRAALERSESSGGARARHG